MPRALRGDIWWRTRFDAASQPTNLIRAVKKTHRTLSAVAAFCLRLRNAWPRRAERGRGQVGATVFA